jgi:hypothetical protein
MVAHSGGLPGFGSVMRWLPEYGVGIIAFGNLTYTGWDRVVPNTFDTLNKTGALRPRSTTASKALLDARDAVSKLIVRWNDQLADRIAAENLFLDQAKDRRRKALDDLHAQVGACTAGSGFDQVENALRGTWTMSCERGKLRVAITSLRPCRRQCSSCPSHPRRRRGPTHAPLRNRLAGRDRRGAIDAAAVRRHRAPRDRSRRYWSCALPGVDVLRLRGGPAERAEIAQRVRCRLSVSLIG